MRVLALSALLMWAGLTLMLSQVRRFQRQPLADRLRVYTPGGFGSSGSDGGILSVASFRDVIAPLARATGERAARLFGVSEELATRLNRVHSPLDVTAFRVRQLGVSAAALLGGLLLALGAGFPTAVALLFIIGAPILAFLVLEQQLAQESTRWQRRIFLELPVVSEQLGMLLSAGYSLGGAVTRIADRGRGAIGADLQRVIARVRQGLTEVDALREWAVVVDVDALDRLVGVLALNRQAGDLGRLIGEEARSIRREVQRELIETIERRSQQVWIPVTVATLLPGSIFLAVPFIEALRLFSGS